MFNGVWEGVGGGGGEWTDLLGRPLHHRCLYRLYHVLSPQGVNEEDIHEEGGVQQAVVVVMVGS